jgi:hypothetical protein
MFTKEAFDKAVAGYVAGAQDIINKHYATNFSILTPPTLLVSIGKRFVKIIAKEQNSSRVYAFLDSTNGDILKPASWKAPAKHARGNVFDADFGLSRTTAYGPEYLK